MVDSKSETLFQYQIRNKPLLTKSCIVLAFVIVLFFAQSIPELNLSLGKAKETRTFAVDEALRDPPRSKPLSFLNAITFYLH